MATASPHPLETYTRAYNDSLTQLLTERIRQEGIRDDDASPDQAAAGEAVANLNERIGRLNDANAAYLVKIFAGIMPPSDQVVNETVAMNNKLAKIVVNANRPAAMLKVVASFLNGAISVFGGTVAAAPAAAPAPPPADAATGG